MLKDSAPARLFIRASILLLRSVAPLSIAYCALRVFRPSSLPSTKAIVVLDVWAAGESLFFLFVYLPRRIWLNRTAPAYCALPSRNARRKAFLKLWDATPDPRNYVSLWFKGVPVEALCREDVKDWLSWNMWNKTTRSLADEEELNEYLMHMQKVLKLNFPEGRSGNNSTAVTFEPVRMMHRPLIWYLFFVGGVDFPTSSSLLLNGYKFYSLPVFSTTRLRSPLPLRPYSMLSWHRSPSSKLSYWYLPHTSTQHVPILFIHAIGVGMFPYADFLKEIRQLNKDQGVGIIAVEILQISGRISPPFPHGREMTQEIQKILEYNSWSRCIVISHSYGSVVATHLLRDSETAPLLGPMLFVDPVAFAFHDPHIAWNFLRRRPTTASEIQLQYFASMDSDVAYTLTRRFVWPENSIWREDVEDRARADSSCRCTVALSGRDIIIETNTMGRYLTRDQSGDEDVKWYQEEDNMNDEWKHRPWTGDKPLDVLWYPELNHAEIFDDKEDRARLLEVIEKYTRQGATISGGVQNGGGIP